MSRSQSLVSSRKVALACFIGLSVVSNALAGPYSPAAGQPGSIAVAKDSSSIVAWATSVAQLTRGSKDIANPAGGAAGFGAPANALGPATGVSTAIVSLGDGGQITLGFDKPITDGPGYDFAVFENGFGDTFLELAFVEVSSNGVDFFRFAANSLTPETPQIGSFGALDPTNLNNLAGSFRAGFGTPFDLSELALASPLLDVNHVTQVKLIDVIGTINPAFATHDSQGRIVNDPYSTAFDSGGFDLDGVAVLHQVPEPAGLVMAFVAALSLLACHTLRR